jgi:anti-sigma regulatory factor (Ser/Thr protein kinase)
MNHVDLPVTAAAGGLARAALDGWLSARVGEAMGACARLAASELVTNAVRHGGLDPGETIQLSYLTTDEMVRIVVEQRSSAAGARIVPADERGVNGGFGLTIVNGCSSRWGVEAGPPGRVWFELDHEPP